MGRADDANSSGSIIMAAETGTECVASHKEYHGVNKIKAMKLRGGLTGSRGT